MVFQRPNPFPTMSIYENVAAGIRLNNKKMKKSDLDDLVERSLRGANLWNEVKDRLNRPGAGLSGGQQQRLCIARAIAAERSEEHTSELQSRQYLVCRLLLEKNK